MSNALIDAAIKLLLPIFVSAGADTLTDIVNRAAPGAGDVVGGIVEQIATKAGVTPATPQAIEEAYRADPNAVVQAVQEVNEFHARIEEGRGLTMRSQHQVQLAEIAAPGLLSRIWRPLLGILFAMECAGLILTTCIAVLARSVPDFNALAPLLALVVPVLTAQAGLLGWDSRQQRLTVRDAG